MRNYFLDYFKILLAIFVVGIHTSPLTEYSKPLSFIFNLGFFRLAVPTFFLINGYYSVSALSNRHSLKKYVVRILTLYAFWMSLYFPIYIYTHDLSAKNIIWGFVVLLYGYGHLWYLTALIGGVILMYYLKNRYSKRTILILAVFLYFFGSVVELMQGYSTTLSRTFATEIFELQMWKLNFLFFGFPFIAIGYYMRQESPQFNRRLYLGMAILIFFIELVVSYYFLTHGRNMLFSLILLTPLILSTLMALNVVKQCNKRWKQYFEKLPNIIYYVHGLPNFFLSIIFVNINTSYKFFAVSVISAIMGIILIKINQNAGSTFKDKFI